MNRPPFQRKPNPPSILVLASVLLLSLCPLKASAQSDCMPPMSRFTIAVSGRITDESGKPLQGVPIFLGASAPIAITGEDGKWSWTGSTCALSPPRCDTGFNARFAPVSPGYFFTPSSGEYCPNHVVDFDAKAAPFTSVSAASYKNTLARGSISTAFAAPGSALATGIESATTLPLPELLAGTSVSITSFSKLPLSNSNVVTKKAQLYYASPDQVNYYIPADLPEGASEVTIQTANGLTLKSSAHINRIAPALFTANSDGKGVPAAVALRVREDGTQQYEPISVFDPEQNRFLPLPIDLGQSTDQVYLILFGTGFSLRNSLDEVSATIGGVEVRVIFAEAQGGLVGLDQSNLLLDRSLAGKGEVDVVFTVEGNSANIVKITIK